MIILVGFGLWILFLQFVLWPVLNSMFWTTMELAAIRDPNVYDLAVEFLAGQSW